MQFRNLDKCRFQDDLPLRHTNQPLSFCPLYNQLDLMMDFGLYDECNPVNLSVWIWLFIHADLADGPFASFASGIRLLGILHIGRICPAVLKAPLDLGILFYM